ncbi:MAG: alcohol dehydrogenase [Bradyrhizobium sp.]|nr:alcohol dehydrogenase [Bradyrhizobium sp.]
MSDARLFLRLTLLVAGLGAIGGCSSGALSPDAAEWPGYGRTPDEQHFSPLTQIDRTTVSRLSLAWSIDLPREARVMEGTPLEVGGVVYFTTSLSIVYAVDAETGRQLWRYDPEAWRTNPRAMRTTAGQPNRGLAYWQGAIFDAASDGRLISLDARTGHVNWSVDTIEEANSRKSSTGAPRVFNGKVIIGNGGADFGTRGYVTAYDAATGKKLWRFFTVPGDPAKGFEDDAMRMAAKTWTGAWWRWGGGGTVWNAITYDPDFNRVYIGTGNASNYNPKLRSPGGGDNLFLVSIVALDADTGKYVWHYQVNPREAWDYKATADIVLADLTIAGQPRKVLMQAPTNGFFYVIDRATGKLISAEKMGKVTWASRIDLATGRPVEAPGIRYENGPATFWPSPFGIHNWQAMSFNPQTGLVYIPTMKQGARFVATPEDIAGADKLVIGSARYSFPIGARYGPPEKPDPDDGTGYLTAWDPVAHKARWTVKLATFWNGGTLATASGLVFQGAGDGWFSAYDGANGRSLWRFQAGNGIGAAPITYSVNGTQYVSVLVGTRSILGKDPGWRFGKQPSRILTFKLDGTAKLPATPPPGFTIRSAFDPARPVDEAAALRGGQVWNHACVVCHGFGVASAGSAAPDLRESSAAQDLATLSSILKQGTLAPGGMPLFDDLTDSEIRELNMYIRSRARAAVGGTAGGPGPTVKPGGGAP